MKTQTERLEFWRETELDDALAWHRANMGEKLTPKLEEAFAAGFNQGWGKLRATLAFQRQREREALAR